MAKGLTKRFGSCGGYSIIELLVTVSILGIVTLAGIPHVDSRREDINTVAQRLVSDLRYARGRSITSGDHFAVEFEGDGYEIQRLTLSGQNWVFDTVVRTGEIPEFLTLSFDGQVDRVEFNTRGMAVSTDEPLWPTIADSAHGANRVLAIWPSGQIHLEG